MISLCLLDNVPKLNDFSLFLDLALTDLAGEIWTKWQLCWLTEACKNLCLLLAWTLRLSVAECEVLDSAVSAQVA